MNLTLELFGNVPLHGEGGSLIKPLNFGQCCYHGHTLPPNITYHNFFLTFFFFSFSCSSSYSTPLGLCSYYIISSYYFLLGPSSAELFLDIKPGLEWEERKGRHCDNQMGRKKGYVKENGWVELSENLPQIFSFQVFFFIDIYSFKIFFFIAV